MPQLDISTYASQLFWMSICFALLCLVIVGFLAPKFGQIIESRNDQIQRNNQEAESFFQESQSLEADNSLRLQKMREQLAVQTQQVREEILQLKTEKLREYDRALALDIQKIRASLYADKKNILDHSTELVVQVVLSVYPKIFHHLPQEGQIRDVLESIKKNGGRS